MAIPPTVAKAQPRAHKRTDLLLAVLVTLLGAAVFVIAIMAATIQKRDETIRSLQGKISGNTAAPRPLFYYATHGNNLPIITTSRRSLSGTGYLLTIRNECTEELPVALSLENPSGARRKTVNIVLDPLHTAEFAHFDEWKLSTGDIVVITHEGFNSVTMRFQ